MIAPGGSPAAGGKKLKAMFTLCSEITIGGKALVGVNDVRIKRSIHELAATAVIKIPVTAVLNRKGQPPAEVETAKEIKTGDEVLIRLGYNDTYNTEFKGYVKRLNLKTPLEIECEDAFYLTRSKSLTLSGKTTLTAILKKTGLPVAEAANLTIESFQAPNRPVSWILAELKKKFGLAMFFNTDGQLYACEPGKVTDETVKYVLRENVIKDDDLKYQKAEDVNLKIKAVCVYRDGTKVEGTTGTDGGTEKTLYFYNVKDQNELAALAKAELKRHSYDGYSGKIQTFLFPFAAPCMIADLEDPVYNERNGRYLIESVETTYNTSGGRRNVEIGRRVAGDT